jgi:Holliday junction resolvase RusA-like endonuclease
VARGRYPRGGYGAVKEFRLVVPGVFIGLNQYIQVERGRAGRYRANQIKQEETDRVAWEALATGVPEQPLFTNPCHITIHWFSRDRRRDVDNIRFACKFILDGLVSSQVLPNDSQRYIASISDVFLVDRDNPRVVIRVEEISPDGATCKAL